MIVSEIARNTNEELGREADDLSELYCPIDLV